MRPREARNCSKGLGEYHNVDGAVAFAEPEGAALVELPPDVWPRAHVVHVQGMAQARAVV
jgi:hypothetical protein